MGDFRLLRLIIGRHAIWLHYTNSPRWNKKRAHFDGYPCHVATSFTSYSDVCEKFRVPVPRTIKNKLKNIWLPLKKINPKPPVSRKFITSFTPFRRVRNWASPPWVPPWVPTSRKARPGFLDGFWWSLGIWIAQWWSASGCPQMSTVCHGKWPSE